MANRKNLAATQLSAGITTTDTSVLVADGSVLPSLPFFATLMPANSIPNSNNSEIVSVTANSIIPAEYRVLGETSQDTYTGKNLFKVADGTHTDNGVTTIVDASKISVNGTVGSNWSGFNLTNGTVSLVETIPAGKYTLSIGQPINFDLNLNFRANTSATQNILVATIPSGATQIIIDLSSSAGAVLMWASADRTRVIAVSDLQLMLEAGSVATAYEPYVGGIPSPSPNYPQPVKMVGGEQVVSVGGRNYSLPLGDIELFKVGNHQDYIYKGKGLNLLDMTTTPLQVWQSTVGEQKNGSITITGTGTSGVNYATMEVPNTLLGKTLTLSWDGNGTAKMVRAYLYNNGSPTTEIQNLGESGSGTFTMPTSLSNTQKVGLIFYVNTGVAIFSNVMLVEGNTAMEFEPYGAKDKWCVRNNVGRLEIDGSSGGYNSTYKWWYVSTSCPRDTAVSSMFLSSTRNAMENDLTMSACATATNAVIIRNSALTQADYVSWLSSNKPVVFYPMTSSSSYMITNTTLTNALNTLADVMAETPSEITATTGYSPAVVDIITPTRASLTIVRAQKGTTAKAFAEGDILANSIYDDGLVYNDNGVLKDASGSNIKLSSENIDFTTLDYQELRANKNTGFVGSAYTKLAYDNVLSEQGTGLFDYDITTGVITATKSCMVNLSASIYPASAFPACLISVYKSDTPSSDTLLARAGKAAGDFNGLHLSVSVKLNAGDKLCLDYYCNASVNANQLGSILFVSAEQRG